MWLKQKLSNLTMKCDFNRNMGETQKLFKLSMKCEIHRNMAEIHNLFVVFLECDNSELFYNQYDVVTGHDNNNRQCVWQF